MIPGSGRSPGKGIGYPLRYSWAFLVAQTVKNLPAMWETCFQSLGWQDLLEEDMATHSSILAWRIPVDRGARQAAAHEVAKSQTEKCPMYTEWKTQLIVKTSIFSKEIYSFKI